MSKTSPNGSTAGPQKWAELTRTRQRLLKALAVSVGDDEFTRYQAETAVRATNLDGIVDDPTKITVRTRMLKRLANEDEYLRFIHKSTGSLYLRDIGADENAGDRITGSTKAQLTEMAYQVLDRENISPNRLQNVDYTDLFEVRNRVNKLVGQRVLVVQCDPHEFAFTDEGLSVAERKV